MPRPSAVFKLAAAGLGLVVALVAWIALRVEESGPVHQRRVPLAQSQASESPQTTRSSVSAGQGESKLKMFDRRIADTAKRLGPEDRHTLALRIKRALWLNYQGRHAEAEAEYRDILEIRSRVLGAAHPDTLATRKLLAAPVFSQGKYAAARAEYDAVIAVRWPTEPIVETGWLATWRQMLPVYKPAGVATESHEAYLAALDSMARVFFLDYPADNAAGLPFRGVLEDHLGLSSAESQFDGFSMARVRGAENADTLRSRHFVDSVLNAQARYPEVEANERDILAIQNRVFGPDHEETLATRVYLATSLLDQEKYEDARAEAEAAYAGFQRVRGPDDPATLAAKRLLEDINGPH